LILAEVITEGDAVHGVGWNVRPPELPVPR
jgi:hypothetical protein